MPVITKIQHRRGTAAQWTTANPVLASGESGLETDTGKLKIGNGSSTWSVLTYEPNNTDIVATYVPLSSKGANSGVATLDSAGKIPVTQLPDSSNTVIASQAYTIALIIGG